MAYLGALGNKLLKLKRLGKTNKNRIENRSLINFCI